MPGGRGVEARSTEGRNLDLASTYKAAETKRQRGRPAGSKNKAKSLIPRELADAILGRLQPVVPPEHYEYMRGVIRDGKAVAVERELDTLILLLSRQMVPALIAETEGEQLPEGVEDPDTSVIRMPEFRKDVTERVKVLKDLIDLKLRNERARDEGTDSTKKPIIEIFARRGLVGDRLRIAFEHTSGGVGGSIDEPEREADLVGDVPVEISERPISLPGSGEGKADRPLDNNLD